MWLKCKPSPTNQIVFSLVVLKVLKVFPFNASIAKSVLTAAKANYTLYFDA